MRIQFKRVPWDLHALAGYVAGISIVLASTDTGTLLAAPLVLFVPGYLLVATLYPGSSDITWVERIAVSVGASLAMAPFIGLLLDILSLGIIYSSVVASLASVSVVLVATSYWRRLHLPAEERLGLDVGSPQLRWRDRPLLDRALTIALVVSLILALVAVAYQALNPRPSDRFTEIYLLGPGGNATSYQSQLKAGQPSSVLVGILNHEYTTMNYTVTVTLIGVRFIRNATSGANDTEILNSTSLPGFGATLADGATGQWSYHFVINASGLWEMQFVLYQSQDFSQPYREVHIFFTVT